MACAAKLSPQVKRSSRTGHALTARAIILASPKPAMHDDLPHPLTPSLPTHPSRWLKSAAWVAQWSLVLMLVVLLTLAAAWGTLHGWIVPRIGDYRIQLQEQAGRALGVPVRIGTLSARSDGLIPALELGDVALLDAQGRAALSLPRVVVALSPRSLWRFGFEQLYIERPELDIRRSAEGRIFIAGLLFSDSDSGDTSAADWLFDQTEVVVRGGTLRWSDELRGAPPLALGDVDVLLRNGNWRHQLRIDATPPPAWGERFTLMGKLREPLLSAHSGNWQQWTGQLFADFQRVDASQLRHYLPADAGVAVAQGYGTVRAWVDVARGAMVGGSADLALSQVSATLGKQLQPLELASIQGRLSGKRQTSGFEVSTHGLQFVTGDGLRWPGGNLRLQHRTAARASPARSELTADRLDLAALSRIAKRLPLGEAAHNALRTYAPQGQVETLQATWQGPFDAQGRYQIKARIHGLALSDTPATAASASTATIGLRGAALEVEMTQAGGKATLRLREGALLLPRIFEDPVLALGKLDTQVHWQIDGTENPRISVQVGETHFANADAQGQLRATWRTSDPKKSSSGARFPGVLELNGTLTRADGTRVHRYLPLVIPAEARHYVRDGVLAGSASTVAFRVKGDLHDLPFNDPKQGEFRIAAQVQNATYAFVPPSVQPAGELPWPALTGLSGELVFERASMQVIGASGQFTGARTVRISQAQTQIADLEHPVVEVSAQASGPLSEFLDIVKKSPIDGLIHHALAQASGSGPAELQLNLRLPIDELHKSTVRGGVTLSNSDVRMTPDTPALTRARGVVQFSDSGFSLKDVHAQALGGAVQLEGGLQVLPANAASSASALQMRGQGSASAEGLRQAPELGFLAQLAEHASGTAPYTLELTMRRGVPEIAVTTNLQGLAVNLPAPLGKAADSALPMRYTTTLTPESLAPDAPLHEDITLDAGALGSVRYVRDISSSSSSAKVLRGAIAVGLGQGEEAPLPEHGVAANLNAAHINVDAWEAVLLPADKKSSAAPVATAPSPASADYLPTTLALRTGALTVQGRTLHDVVAGGARDGAVWRVNLDARQLNGYLEYHPAGAPRAPNGRLFARLSRLEVPPSSADTDTDTAAAVEALLNEQPGSLPALDIAVSDFHLRGRALGRLEVIATNHGSEGAQRAWHLQTFNLTTPEAALSANGSWALLNPSASTPGAQRRTELSFHLDINDSGALLQRFGMAGVIRRGKGQMRGQVRWRGAPLSPDYASMNGQINLNFESGQFLKAEPGLAKLLSVLSLQSLPRRLTLDFRDVFSQGFAFDFVRGDVTLAEGIASTNNLQMKGVNAAVLMEGSANIAKETQNLHVVVVPEINAMTASLVATAINPVIGLGSFLAQMFLRGPLMQAATQEFHIDGTWADPRVERVQRGSKDAAAADKTPPTPTTPTTTAPTTEGVAP